ncbi:MAG: hypothetical protein IKN01_02685 [Prevotella sp.]|jgi:hypothetical protein|nr:hypothetical protein [Prevotella sp.]
MEEKKDVTQIVNNYGPLRGNVERQFILAPTGHENPKEEQEDCSKWDEEKVAAVKVRAKVLLELMKRSGIGLDKKDRTKVCRLAALVMGCNYKALLNTVAEGISLNERTHRKDVDQANLLLDDLEADFRLNF